jgi:transcriptional regulator with XRE-family HTH domain
MAKSKNFFAENLRFLRERRKMTQQELADRLGATRSKVNALESGQTKSPVMDDLLSVSELFGISIDSLIRVELGKLGELKLRELEAGNDVYIRGGNLRVLAISVDRDNNENVEYVPVKAKAGYRAGYNDPEFIAALPKYSLPNLPGSGTFRIFPTTGDSMEPIPEGSDVIAQYVADWTVLKPDTPCIVILKEGQDFVFKLVTLGQDGRILLKSLNPLFDPYTVPVEEVLEIWAFYAYTSREIPEQEADIRQLMRMMAKMQTEIGELRKMSGSG